jgi:hypothetical protein
VIVATIHNGSVEAPAFKVIVEFLLHDFGVGPVPEIIGATTAEVVQVQGLPPTTVTIPWKSPPTGGHKCVIVRLTPVEDSNPANNVGQKNVQIAAVASGAAAVGPLSVPLFNPTARELRLQLIASAYRLREPAADRPRPAASHRSSRRKRFMTDVEFRDLVRRNRSRIVAANRLGRFPLPPGWSLGLPAQPVAVPAGVGIDVPLHITLPAGTPNGVYPVSVHAMSPTGTAVGGVTFLITVGI